MPACVKATTAQEGAKFAAGFKPPNLNKVLALYRVYQTWIERYRGALTGISIAQGILHESGGNPLSTSSPSLKESGLWSIVAGVMQNLNIDPFDPEANIWAGAWLRNDRLRQIVEDPEFSWLRDADPYDWTVITGKMPGSLGFPGWKVMMRKIFPSPPPKGSGQRVHPYQYIRTWVLSRPGQVPKLGEMGPGIVACRMLRDIDTPQLASLGALYAPGQYMLVPRPAHLPLYNETKFRKVWGTPKLLRPALFPEYLRTPGLPEGRPQVTSFAAVLAALVLGTTVGYVGYIGYRERDTWLRWLRRGHRG